MRWLLMLVVFAASALSFTACSDIPATNPYDPGTPADQQRTGRVDGTLALPDGFDESGLLLQARVVLGSGGATPVQTTTADARGAFVFEKVPAGVYTVDVSAPGLVAPPRVFVLGIGEARTLPVIQLALAQGAAIEGVARLAGAPAEGHAGVTVEAVGTPFNGRTGSDGRFRLEVVAGTFDLRLSFPGYDGVSIPGVHVAPGETTVLEAPVTLTGAPGSIRGTVQRAPGFENPFDVGGATVALRAADATPEAPPLVTTSPDQRGAFVFGDLQPGTYRVDVALEGLVAPGVEALLPVGGAVDVGTLVLFAALDPDRPAYLAGTARLLGAPDGRHGGIRVEVAGAPFVTVTGSEGDFRLEVPVATHDLRFTFPGYGPQTVPGVRAEAGATVELSEAVVLVGEPGRIQGRIGFAGGYGDATLLGRVSVALSADTGPAPEGEPLQQRAPDADGRYLFESVATGAYTLRATLDGYATVTRSVFVPVGGVAIAGDIELVPVAASGTLAGIARIQNGGPQAHGRIRVEAVGTPHFAETTAGGDWALTVPVRREAYTLEFSRDGYTSVRLEVPAPAPGATVVADEVTLVGSPGRLAGLVVLRGEGGVAVADARLLLETRVRLFPLGADVAAAEAIPDLDGTYAFPAVAPGSYRVTAELRGFQPASRLTAVEVGQAVLVDELVLRPDLAPGVAAYIEGRARLACPAGCDHGGILVEAVGRPFVTVTGSDGDFRLEVVPGDYELRFSRAGYGTTPVAVIGVEEGETVPLGAEVLLPLVPGSVSGRILRARPQGDALAADGALVSLSDGPTLLVSASADAEGRFLLAPVPEGAFSLRVDLPRHSTLRQPLRLGPGEALALDDLTLALAGGGLAGAVARRDAPGLGGLWVVATGANSDPDVAGLQFVEATAPGTDAFRFSNLPPGLYAVTATGDGYRTPPTEEIRVEPAAEAFFAATLEPRLAALEAPAWTTGEVVLRFTRDADLTFAQVWLDAPVPPANARFLPLAGPAQDTWPLTLSTDGPHVIHARLANAAAVGEAPGGAVLAAVSADLTATVVRDTSPPVVSDVTVGEGSGFTRNRTVDVAVTCADDRAPAADLRLQLTVDDGTRSDGAYRARLPLVLAAGEGPRRVRAVCTDAAGNPSPEVSRDFVFDATPPTVRTFTLNGGAAGLATNDPTVRVDLEVADAGAGVDGVALAEVAFDCAAAAYTWPAPGGFALPPGEGVRRLFACVRDRAGNTTGAAVPTTNTVTLDTLRPATPTLVLGDGSGWTPRSTVALTVSTTDDAPAAHQLVLTGDVPGGRQAMPWAGRPATLDLRPGEGPRRVRAEVVDAAGNVSAPVDATITVDTTPPAALAAVIGDGSGYITVAGGLTDLQVLCGDNLAPAEALTLRLETAGRVLYDGPYRPTLSVAVGNEQGEGALTVTCRDAAGLSGTLDPSEPFFVDTVPPTVTLFRVNGGGEDEPTNQLTANVAVAVTDDGGSGVMPVALSEDPQFDCTRANYVWPPEGTYGFPVADAEGRHRLSLCARDRAGNVAARELANAILLDTVAPAAGRLTLANGAGFSSTTANVALAIAPPEPGLAVELRGDLVEVGRTPAAPAQITLLGPDGPRRIQARLFDAAGNASPVFESMIELDRVAPQVFSVVLANGQTPVNTQTIAVTHGVTGADTMRLWNAATVGDACGDPVCSDPGFVPFLPATTHTLLPNRGNKKVCWKFCDLAGNGSAVGSATVALSTYVARPTPVLTSLATASLTPYACGRGLAPSYTVEARGRGMASDTQMQIGDFLLACQPAQPSPDCVPDAGGGCGAGGECERTCAESCVATLPPAVYRVAATSAVRLVTPAPVVNGLGTSSALLFDVVAPLPGLRGVDVVTARTPALMSRRGVIQDVLANGQPVGQDLELDLTGCGLMGNTQYRLGGSFGTLVSLTDPDPAAGPTTGEQTARVRFNTAGLQPQDLVDLGLAAVSPSPGGGEVRIPFGLNQRSAPCPVEFPCVSNLRGTRAVLPNERGVYQAFGLSGSQRQNAIAWAGGTAAGLRGPDGALLARLRFPSAGGVLPFVFGDAQAVRVEDASGTGPSVTLEAPLGLRGDGTLRAGLRENRLTIRARASDVTVADLDGDGMPDVLGAIADDDVISVFYGNGDGTFAPREDVPMCDLVSTVRIADLDADGRPDLVGMGVGAESMCVRFNRGGRTLSALTTVASPGASFNHRALLTDLNADHLPDLVWRPGIGMSYRLGRPDGTFGAVVSTRTISNNDPNGGFAVGDVDGDGRVDLVATRFTGGLAIWLAAGAPGAYPNAPVEMGGVSGGTFPVLADLDGNGALDVVATSGADSVVVWWNGGAGTFTSQVLTMGSNPEKVAVADLDGDGRPDLVTANNAGQSIVVRRRAADGSFRADTPVVFASGPSALALGDLNLDGALDLVKAGDGDIDGPELAAMYGNPVGEPGIRRDYRFNAGREMRAVAFGDVDRDGDTDLLAMSSVGYVERWLWAQRGGVWGYGDAADLPNPIGMANGFSDELLFVDVTGDGIGDLVQANGDAVYVSRGGAGGVFDPVDRLRYDATNRILSRLAAADLNGDAVPEIVATSNASDEVIGFTWRAGVGWQNYALAAVGDGPRGLAATDVDADGRQDLVVANATAGSLSVLRGVAGGFAALQTVTTLPAGRSPFLLAVGDLNGDARPDVVSLNSFTPNVSVFLHSGNGAAPYAAHTEYALGRQTKDLRLADFNNDGRLDLVTAGGPYLSFRLGLGNGAFGTLFEIPAGTNLFDLAIADLNGDGAPDIATANGAGGSSVWWMPGRREVTQELTDLPATSLPLPAGRTSTTVHQAAQYIDALAVRVRIEGAGLGALVVSLRAPDGRLVELDRGADYGAATVWQASYPTKATTGSLAPLLDAWQPEGDWALVVDNAGGAQATLRDFAVLTHGAFLGR